MYLVLSHLIHLMNFAANPTPAAGAAGLIANSAASACGSNCGSSSITNIFHSLTNVLIFLVGSISVIMIIIGGLRYVLSNGDSKGAESARNTILYSVIGIVISIAAYGIVVFVTTNFK